MRMANSWVRPPVTQVISKHGRAEHTNLPVNMAHVLTFDLILNSNEPFRWCINFFGVDGEAVIRWRFGDSKHCDCAIEDIYTVLFGSPECD